MEREIAKMFERMSKATANETCRLTGDVPVALLTLALVVKQGFEALATSIAHHGIQR